MKRQITIAMSIMALSITAAILSSYSQSRRPVQLGEFIEIAKGIECTFELSQNGPTTILRPVLRGKSTLSGPMQVTINLQKQRYKAWAQSVPFIEAEIEVLVDKSWISPAEDAIHMHIRVNPGKENRFFTIRYNTGKKPSRVRFTLVESGAVYEFMCDTSAFQSQTFMIDNFDKEALSEGEKYPKYIGAQKGYDIYYENADIELSMVKISTRDTSDKALQIKFNLPPAFSWGNWLSVRREFKSSMNLENYRGLELNLRVDVPSPDAFLRITLADLADDMKSGDELWWSDCDRSLLKTKTQKGIQVHIPFDDFVLSFGEGTRHNDYKLNLKKIIAYEISFIAEPGKHSNGVILLDSLHTYK